MPRYWKVNTFTYTVLPTLGHDRLRIIASICRAVLQLAGMFSKIKKNKEKNAALGRAY